MLPSTIGILAAIATGLGSGNYKELTKLGPRKSAWLNTFTPVAKFVCDHNKVPYQACVTQAALESGWGLSAPNNNFYGIKINNTDYAKYNTIADGIQAYCNAIKNNQFFKPALDNYNNNIAYDTVSDNTVIFLIWIWAAGYAENEDYVKRSIGVMNLIYRVTGNEDFDASLTTDQAEMINYLLKFSYGSSRRNTMSNIYTSQ